MRMICDHCYAKNGRKLMLAAPSALSAPMWSWNMPWSMLLIPKFRALRRSRNNRHRAFSLRDFKPGRRFLRWVNAEGKNRIWESRKLRLSHHRIYRLLFSVGGWTWPASYIPAKIHKMADLAPLENLRHLRNIPLCLIRLTSSMLNRLALLRRSII